MPSPLSKVKATFLIIVKSQPDHGQSIFQTGATWAMAQLRLNSGGREICEGTDQVLTFGLKNVTDYDTTSISDAYLE